MFQIGSARVRIFPFFSSSTNPTIKMFAPGKFLSARERGESFFKNFPPFETGGVDRNIVASFLFENALCNAKLGQSRSTHTQAHTYTRSKRCIVHSWNTQCRRNFLVFRVSFFARWRARSNVREIKTPRQVAAARFPSTFLDARRFRFYGYFSNPLIFFLFFSPLSLSSIAYK